MVDQVIDKIIVEGDAADIFKLWARFEDFPKFMKNIKSVTKSGDETSHWVMEGPLGKELEWDAKTTRKEENKRIAWASTGGDIQTSGQVTFNALPNHQSEIQLVLNYTPPAGEVGKAVAEILGDPEKRISEDLRNFKRFAEGMLTTFRNR
jgi:uncharacterized membrane protein